MTTHHHIRFGFIEAAAVALAGLTAVPFVIKYLDERSAVQEALIEVRAEQSKAKQSIDSIVSELPQSIDPQGSQCSRATDALYFRIPALGQSYRQAVEEERELSGISDKEKAQKLADIQAMIDGAKQRHELFVDQCYKFSPQISNN